MTETQAKSGTAETPAKPVDEEAAKDGTPAAGRAVVGRAAVPADAPAPKFTRAPGMAPPPDQPAEEEPDKKESADGTAAAVTSPALTVPIRTNSETTPPKDGRVGTGGKQDQAGTARPGTAAKSSGGGLPPGIGRAAAIGAARVNDAVRAARGAVSSAASRGPRRARLNLKRIDPWSVMKFAFAVSLVLFIVVVVATSVLYLALDAMGVFESVNEVLTDAVSASGGQGDDSFKITAKGVILSSALVGLVNIVLFTALATLGAFIYNVCADLVGGIEVTLAERD